MRSTKRHHKKVTRKRNRTLKRKGVRRTGGIDKSESFLRRILKFRFGKVAPSPAPARSDLIPPGERDNKHNQKLTQQPPPTSVKPNHSSSPPRNYTREWYQEQMAEYHRNKQPLPPDHSQISYMKNEHIPKLPPPTSVKPNHSSLPPQRNYFPSYQEQLADYHRNKQTPPPDHSQISYMKNEHI